MGAGRGVLAHAGGRAGAVGSCRRRGPLAVGWGRSELVDEMAMNPRLLLHPAAVGSRLGRSLGRINALNKHARGFVPRSRHDSREWCGMPSGSRDGRAISSVPEVADVPKLAS